MIRLAAQVALSKIAHGICGLDGLRPLRDCMIQRLYGLRPLTVQCLQCQEPGAEGFTAGRGVGEIGLCQPALASGQQRLNSVFFHELIHACGGDELDAEGLENHCFHGAGATPPTPDDFRLFRLGPNRQGWVAGRFLLWNPRTGQLFVKGPDGVTPVAPLNAIFRSPS